MSARYVLGIDLGTTNSVLAYSPLDAELPDVQLLPVPQLVAGGTVEARTTLPSFLYLASEHESDDAYRLPWANKRSFAVGHLARSQSAEMPDRTVGAAKSWLCHSRVDRHAAILPWQAPAEVEKISPVEASQRYLEHLVAAWEHEHPEAPVTEQVVVLTVPASFDASARELTREAALAAGLPADLVLLEEPQSAVYAWLHETGDRWRKVLTVGDQLLVCDVGGGTTDLSLITVTDEEGDFVLRRLAVGDHLLVGGDNMDLALAHYVAGLFQQKGVTLDPWQSVSLWHSCRTAKEALLATDGPATHTVSVLGRGSKLIKGTVSVEVERAAAQKLLLDGFFPFCDAVDRPQRQRFSGFQDIGLPFESDPAVTRHLAAFLHTHGPSGTGPRPRGVRVLFNGGVFKGESFPQRLMKVMSGWFGKEETPAVLEGTRDLDHAVARGAAFYGWTKERGGLRIRGGTARAYYVGIETAGLAVPGAPRPLRGLCVVPIGMEEGTAVDVPSGEIGLVVGEPARFRFFKSSVRKDDRPGDTLPTVATEDLEETAPMEATLPPDDAVDDPFVPVTFHSKVNELGLLELWCVSTKSDNRWKLEFSVREDSE